MENGGDEDEAIAALLHDSIEDRDATTRAVPRRAADRPRGAQARHRAAVRHGRAVDRTPVHRRRVPSRGAPAEKGSLEEWRRRKQSTSTG